MKSDVSVYARSGSGSFISRLSAFLRARRLIYVRDLLLTLVGRDLTLRYKRSVLGIAWSLLTPLAQLGVYYLIFNVLLPLNVPNYLSFLFIGVLVWSWFQGSLLQATSVIVENRELIKRPGFPRAVLPAVTVASYLIHFLLAMPILLVLLALAGIPFTSAILALPLLIVIQFILTLSLAYFTATLYVPFRDTQHLLGVLLNLLFFLSPVFYQSSALPAQYQTLFHLNPMVRLLESYRGIFLDGRWPDGMNLLLLTVPAMVALILGYYVFRKASDHLIDHL